MTTADSRRVSFIVTAPSSALARLAEVASALDLGVERGVRVDEVFFEIRRVGPSSTFADDLISDVLAKLALVAELLNVFRSEFECATILRIVQEFERSDEIGPGFSLSVGQVELLFNVGAFIDVDA
jgi:hypothetical protein